MITTFAFIAAFEAARKAGEALIVSNEALQVSNAQLALERELVLGLRQSARYQDVVSRVELFVVDNEPAAGPAPAKTERDYVPVVFTFENLGRTALLDTTVNLLIDGSGVKPVKIGNIRPDHEAHVFLYIEWEAAPPPIVRWSSEAVVNGTSLNYHPPQRVAIARNVVRKGAAPHGNKRKWTFREPEELTEIAQRSST